jgi:hypothetical protein
MQNIIWITTLGSFVISCLFVFSYFKSERDKSDKWLLMLLLYVSIVPIVLAWIIELQYKSKVFLNPHDAFNYFILGLLLLLIANLKSQKKERTSLLVETVFLVYLMIVFFSKTSEPTSAVNEIINRHLIFLPLNPATSIKIIASIYIIFTGLKCIIIHEKITSYIPQFAYIVLFCSFISLIDHYYDFIFTLDFMTRLSLAVLFMSISIFILYKLARSIFKTK